MGPASPPCLHPWPGSASKQPARGLAAVLLPATYPLRPPAWLILPAAATACKSLPLLLEPPFRWPRGFPLLVGQLDSLPVPSARLTPVTSHGARSASRLHASRMEAARQL